MIDQAMIDKAVDAVCEVDGRTNTASAVLRAMIEVGDLRSLSAIANQIRKRSREKATEKRRMQILRVLTKRACVKLETVPLGYKLDKELDLYVCGPLDEKPKVEKDKVAEALQLVLQNLDREDVIKTLHTALGLAGGLSESGPLLDVTGVRAA